MYERSYGNVKSIKSIKSIKSKRRPIAAPVGDVPQVPNEAWLRLAQAQGLDLDWAIPGLGELHLDFEIPGLAALL